MLVPANTFAEMYFKMKDQIRDYKQQIAMFEDMVAKNEVAMAEIESLCEWTDDGVYASSQPYTDAWGDLITPPEGYIVPGSEEPIV